MFAFAPNLKMDLSHDVFFSLHNVPWASDFMVVAAACFFI